MRRGCSYHPPPMILPNPSLLVPELVSAAADADVDVAAFMGTLTKEEVHQIYWAGEQLKRMFGALLDKPLTDENIREAAREHMTLCLGCRGLMNSILLKTFPFAWASQVTFKEVATILAFLEEPAATFGATAMRVQAEGLQCLGEFIDLRSTAELEVIYSDFLSEDQAVVVDKIFDGPFAEVSISTTAVCALTEAVRRGARKQARILARLSGAYTNKAITEFVRSSLSTLPNVSDSQRRLLNAVFDSNAVFSDRAWTNFHADQPRTGNLFHESYGRRGRRERMGSIPVRV